MRFDTTAPRRRLISLTPLIDVVFILLVFFMLASSLVTWQVVELGAAAAQGDGNTLVGSWLVRVHADGLDLNAEPISEADLAARVVERVAGGIGDQADQPILVMPSPGVDLQRLVDILDRLRQAGATHLTLLQP